MKRLFPLILILLLSSCQRKAVEEFVSYVKAADELFSSGQDEEAMIALTSAEDAYTEDVPLVELGSVKMRKGDIYYRFSNFKDVRAVVLEVWRGNEDVMGFYEKQGFELRNYVMMRFNEPSMR